MGTGASGSMGLKVTRGDTTHRNLEPDSRADTDQPIAALAAGGQIDMPLQDMFWGGYFGSLTDEFGVRQMVNCAGKG